VSSDKVNQAFFHFLAQILVAARLPNTITWDLRPTTYASARGCGRCVECSPPTQ